MRKTIQLLALAFLVQISVAGTIWQTRTQKQWVPYPGMVPLDQYLMPDENSEIALARSAAPASIRTEPK
jgi:hypothetical protein